MTNFTVEKLKSIYLNTELTIEVIHPVEWFMHNSF
jgi:hypothetical protein